MSWVVKTYRRRLLVLPLSYLMLKVSWAWVYSLVEGLGEQYPITLSTTTMLSFRYDLEHKTTATVISKRVLALYYPSHWLGCRPLSMRNSSWVTLPGPARDN